MKTIGVDLTKSNPNPAVLCDFDDTTALENVAELLLNQFGDGEWLAVREKHRQGLITLKSYQEVTFAAIKADKQVMKSLVKEKATLRPYFKELSKFCQKMRIPLAIVSHGLDFYIEALLEKENLANIPIFAVQTDYTDQGITYKYPYAWAQCEWESGNCKCATLRRYRDKGHTILYAGDGKSDYCPASKEADYVFARSSLVKQCQQGNVPFVEFENFSTVIDVLKLMTNQPVGES